MLSRTLMVRLVASAALILRTAALALAAPATYAVTESKSAVRVHVGKSGVFSFAGHKHEILAPVSGNVTADPANLAASSVELTFQSARLTVLEEGEPKGDALKVEEVMRGPKVLDTVQFPTIHFRSKKVTGRAIPGAGFELSLVGELSLHGVTQEITLPVKVALDGRTLTATGHTALRHDQFGMKPVTVGGGAVKVDNEIGIDFKVVAELR